jgi:hypothetical protein
METIATYRNIDDELRHVLRTVTLGLIIALLFVTLTQMKRLLFNFVIHTRSA